MSNNKCKGLTGDALIECYKKPGGIIYNHEKFLKDVEKKANARAKAERAKQKKDTTNTTKSVRVSQPLAPTQFND
jgi:hypothetical protein